MSLDLCLIPTVTKQHIGGRIAYFYRKWQNITSDPWVVETVVGYKRVFLESPHQAYIPTVHASMEDKDLKDQEVLSLQQSQTDPVHKPVIHCSQNREWALASSKFQEFEPV